VSLPNTCLQPTRFRVLESAVIVWGGNLGASSGLPQARKRSAEAQVR